MEFFIHLYVLIRSLFDDLKPKPGAEYEEIERGLGIKDDPKT